MQLCSILIGGEQLIHDIQYDSDTHLPTSGNSLLTSTNGEPECSINLAAFYQFELPKQKIGESPTKSPINPHGLLEGSEPPAEDTSGPNRTLDESPSRGRFTQANILSEAKMPLQQRK